MILFIAIFAVLLLTMLLLAVGTLLGRRSIEMTCGRGEECCRRSGAQPGADSCQS